MTYLLFFVAGYVAVRFVAWFHENILSKEPAPEEHLEGPGWGSVVCLVCGESWRSNEPVKCICPPEKTAA
jgi:hypothetical protein